VPPHVEERVAKIAELHDADYREAGALQKLASSATAAVGRPRTLVIVVLMIAVRLGVNLGLTSAGWSAPDPFHILAAAASTIDLCLAAMILVAQRHDDELATRRDQLTLEIAIPSERRTAKIIALWRSSAATIGARATNATRSPKRWRSRQPRGRARRDQGGAWGRSRWEGESRYIAVKVLALGVRRRSAALGGLRALAERRLTGG
jgi:uncharacterized membrane protein